MTDGAVTITIDPAGAVTALDIWGDPDAVLARIDVRRAIRVEPRRWWLIDAAADIAVRLGDDGAATPIGGGLMRARFKGSGWRSKLMIAGVFDAENPAFAVGCAAATILHHVPVWIDILDADECHVYFAASHTGGMGAHWGV